MKQNAISRLESFPDLLPSRVHHGNVMYDLSQKQNMTHDHNGHSEEIIRVKHKPNIAQARRRAVSSGRIGLRFACVCSDLYDTFDL